METGPGTSREDRASLERKYIRIQTWGMAVCLSTPVAWILAGMYDLQFILPLFIVVLPMIGVIIFAIGHTLRQELKEKQQHGD